jgi:hypothetical protein
VLIPKWKWDEIAMDFILGLPKAPTREDSIWVMVVQIYLTRKCTDVVNL